MREAYAQLVLRLLDLPSSLSALMMCARFCHYVTMPLLATSTVEATEPKTGQGYVKLAQFGVA